MGAPKKEVSMKISDHSVPSLNQNVQNNQKTQPDFEDWLKSPTKQNSGDEFYWQHQDQLQQSSLQFNHHPEHNQHGETVLEISTKQPQSTSLDPKAVIETEHIQQTTDFSKTTPNNRLILHSTELMRALTELEQNNSQPPVPESNSASKIQASDALQFENTSSVEFKDLCKGPLKNHHLFIQNDEVEISLYAEDLNKEEQIELKHMIKLNLKNKGLSLKQLLINGVQHD